jgi:hypothetical protein
MKRTTRKLPLISIAIACGAGAASPPAAAHHSFAVYDATKMLTVNGTVKTFQWTNPGDKVTIEYHPLRDGSHGGGLNSVTLTDTGQKLQANFGAQEKPGLK